MRLRLIAILCVLGHFVAGEVPCFGNGAGEKILSFGNNCHRQERYYNNNGYYTISQDCPRTNSTIQAFGWRMPGVCRLRIFFEDELRGCRCVIEKDDNCIVWVNPRWSNKIKSMDVIGDCTWEIARTNTDTARVGPHLGNNYKWEYNTYNTFGLDGQRLYRIRPWA